MDDSDFTTTGTGTVTLASAANLNDVINIVSFETNIPDSDYVPASGGTFSGNVSMSGTLGVTGAVTASNGLTVDDDGATPLTVDRATSNGTLVDFQKDGSSVGSISTASELAFNTTTGYASLKVNSEGDGLQYSNVGTRHFGPWLSKDNAVDLGRSNGRFKDAYLGGGAYLGGTAATNKLDYYAEGSWTVNITKGGSALPVNNRYGYYTRIGDLLFIAFYWYHNGGLSSQTNNTTEYRVEGLPFTPLHLANGAYQAVPVGYLQINSTNLFNTYPHRWQCNSTTQLSLYGNNYATTHSSGALELGGAGVLKLA